MKKEIIAIMQYFEMSKKYEMNCCQFTSHDAFWIFSFGSKDVWSKHGRQVLDVHLITAGAALNLIQKPAHTSVPHELHKQRGWSQL